MQCIGNKQEVKNLEEKCENLEMYGRRNGVRVYGIPFIPGENTDNIIMSIANKTGANIPIHGLSRSHRIKRMPGTQQTGSPQIIAKFISHDLNVEFL